MNENCSSCLRPVWVGDDDVSTQTISDCCSNKDGAVCKLRRERNILLANIKALLKTPNDHAIVRTARSFLEEIEPSGHSCPVCSQPYVVRKGSVVVHFASPLDRRPCSASYKRVIGGAVDTK